MNKKFYSTRKILYDMGDPFKDNVELVSFHSISKGVSGDCGFRGGYFDYVNLDQHIQDMIFKMKSVALCSNTLGMIGMALMVNQPTQDNTSPDVYNLH